MVTKKKGRRPDKFVNMDFREWFNVVPTPERRRRFRKVMFRAQFKGKEIDSALVKLRCKTVVVLQRLDASVLRNAAKCRFTVNEKPHKPYVDVRKHSTKATSSPRKTNFEKDLKHEPCNELSSVVKLLSTKACVSQSLSCTNDGEQKETDSELPPLSSVRGSHSGASHSSKPEGTSRPVKLKENHGTEPSIIDPATAPSSTPEAASISPVSLAHSPVGQISAPLTPLSSRCAVATTALPDRSALFPTGQITAGGPLTASSLLALSTATSSASSALPATRQVSDSLAVSLPTSLTDTALTVRSDLFPTEQISVSDSLTASSSTSLSTAAWPIGSELPPTRQISDPLTASSLTSLSCAPSLVSSELLLAGQVSVSDPSLSTAAWPVSTTITVTGQVSETLTELPWTSFTPAASSVSSAPFPTVIASDRDGMAVLNAPLILPSPPHFHTTTSPPCYPHSGILASAPPCPPVSNAPPLFSLEAAGSEYLVSDDGIMEVPAPNTLPPLHPSPLFSSVSSFPVSPGSSSSTATASEPIASTGSSLSSLHESGAVFLNMAKSGVMPCGSPVVSLCLTDAARCVYGVESELSKLGKKLDDIQKLDVKDRLLPTVQALQECVRQLKTKSDYLKVCLGNQRMTSVAALTIGDLLKEVHGSTSLHLYSRARLLVILNVLQALSDSRTDPQLVSQVFMSEILKSECSA